MRAFECYAKWIAPMQEYFAARYPQERVGFRRRPSVGDPGQGARHAARPAAGRDAVQPRDLRHRPGVRSAAAAHARAARWPRPGTAPTRCSRELRKVIPAFLVRVDQPERGGRWSDVPGRRAPPDGRRSRPALLDDSAPEPRPEVTLTDFDPDGEVRIVAAALYAVSDLPDDQLHADRAPDVGRRARRGAPRLRRRAHESAAPPRPRVRTHGVPVRHPDRLRRVPRSAAASAAHARVAAAHARATASPNPMRSAKPARRTTGRA